VPLLGSAPSFPKVPTLVLGGALDTITPSDEGRQVAHEFPKGQFAELPFVGHVTALADFTGCAASVVRGFVGNHVVDTSCSQEIQPPAPVEDFPRLLADEPPATDALNVVHAPRRPRTL
jgi:hypothetical protein